MSMTADEAVRHQVEQFYAAVNRLQHGDPAPMLALWSHDAEVTHMGPHGGQQRGWAAVRTYWEEAARLPSVSPADVHAAPAIRSCA